MEGWVGDIPLVQDRLAEPRGEKRRKTRGCRRNHAWEGGNLAARRQGRRGSLHGEEKEGLVRVGLRDEEPERDPRGSLCFDSLLSSLSQSELIWLGTLGLLKPRAKPVLTAYR